MNWETVIKITCFQHMENKYLCARYNKNKNILNIKCSEEFIENILEKLKDWRIEIYYMW